MRTRAKAIRLVCMRTREAMHKLTNDMCIDHALTIALYGSTMMSMLTLLLPLAHSYIDQARALGTFSMVSDVELFTLQRVCLMGGRTAINIPLHCVQSLTSH